MELRVKHGKVCLDQSFVLKVTYEGNRALLWLQDLGLAGTAQVSLLDLLEKMQQWRPRPLRRGIELLGQILLRLGLRLEQEVTTKHRRAVMAGSAADEVFPWDIATPAQVSCELVKYWQMQQATMRRGVYHLSMASDKSRVLGMTLLNTAMVFPDNSAFWCFPAVLPHRNIVKSVCLLFLLLSGWLLGVSCGLTS